MRVREWERSRRIQSSTFKGVAPHSLYLLLMSGIPTHPIRAVSALGQPKLRNSRCFLMEEKRNISEPREREREWETDGKRANDRIEQGKLDSAPFLRTISCIYCFCLNGCHYGEQSVHTNACHTTVFYSTLSWRVSCLSPGGWFTAKIKQSKSLIHPIFFSFFSFCSATLCNSILQHSTGGIVSRECQPHPPEMLNTYVVNVTHSICSTAGHI